MSTELHSQKSVANLMDQVLDLAKKGGATSAEVDIDLETGFSATARMAESETMEYNQDNNVSITVYQDYRSGSVTTSDMRDGSLQEAVAAALRIARYTEADPMAGLADKNLLAKTVPTLEIDFPWDITPEQAMQQAMDCDQMGLDHSPLITNSEGVTLGTHRSLAGYANSHGFNHNYHETRHTISSVLVAEQHGQMQRDYYYYTARDPKALPSLADVARQAAERTVSRLNPRPVKTGAVPVLFSAETARSFFSHFVSAIQGRSLYKQSSFLLDYLNKPIFPEWLTLTEQPHLPGAVSSIPFDRDGLLTYDKTFVESGALKSFSLSSYAARKLNMQPTANAGGLHNLIVPPGEHSFTEMLQALDTGIMVTEVMGSVNLVTGDYSRGVCGFWVEKGEVQFPVDEATLAGSLLDMFKNIRLLGNDTDKRGRIQAPSILIDNVMLGGGG
jgi:PmbA protein